MISAPLRHSFNCAIVPAVHRLDDVDLHPGHRLVAVAFLGQEALFGQPIKIAVHVGVVHGSAAPLQFFDHRRARDRLNAKKPSTIIAAKKPGCVLVSTRMRSTDRVTSISAVLLEQGEHLRIAIRKRAFLDARINPIDVAERRLRRGRFR